MRVNVIKSSDVPKLIKDGDVLVTGGFLGSAVPEEIEIEIEKYFLENNYPKDLTLMYAAGQGDGKTKGLNHFGHEGLIKRVIGGHWGLVPKLQKLALENKIEAYNLPQGVIAHMFRDIAAGKPGTITHVGLKTFVDPRLEGGKINDVTKEDIVELITIGEKEYLFYKAQKIDVAILRGTYADELGNISMEEEAVTLEATSIACACKNSGGKVIVQVKEIVKSGTLDPKLIKIPGIYVDSIVVVENKENHKQTFEIDFNPSFSGQIKIPVDSVKPLELDERKIIARRAAMELKPNTLVNLGIGMPEGVAMVANEEGIGDNMVLTVEAGPIGGIPAGGQNFGTCYNPEAILDQPYQFDFYDGGGLDIAYLGLAQCDEKGNVNVSKFGPKIAGAGGFINITQNSKKVIYCGTFTAGGLKIEVKGNELVVINEGKVKKFTKQVEQITFSGEYASQNKKEVLYITERAVFELQEQGLVLTEIAPGVDLEKDILSHMEFKPIISDNLRIMDERIFAEEIMGIKENVILSEVTI